MPGPCYPSKPTASYYYTSAATILFAVLFLQTSAVAEQVSGASGRPDLATIIRKITEAQMDNRDRAKPYSVTREYKVFGSDAVRPRTEVVAKVNFLPPNVKRYDIDQSTGGMGEKIVRRILDHEVDATRDPKTMMITERNYDFNFGGEQAIGNIPCYRLRISPKHDRKDLLNATIWVDKDSYRIVRMEGEPAKSPSFWVRDVHVVLEFGEIAGMWLQTGTYAMGHLRFGGEYKIISQNLDYDVSQAVAANTRQPRPMPRRHSSAMLAAGMR